MAMVILLDRGRLMSANFDAPMPMMPGRAASSARSRPLPSERLVALALAVVVAVLAPRRAHADDDGDDGSSSAAIAADDAGGDDWPIMPPGLPGGASPVARVGYVALLMAGALLFACALYFGLRQCCCAKAEQGYAGVGGSAIGGRICKSGPQQESEDSFLV